MRDSAQCSDCGGSGYHTFDPPVGAYAANQTERCPSCGGSGMEPGWPQPDSFGNYDPCDRCEGAGTIDQEESE